jgi:hypothetical protein
MHGDNIGDNLVALVGIIAVFVLPLGYAAANRYFAHMERMAMISRGITPPPDPRWNRRGWVPPDPSQMQQGYDPYFYQWQSQRALRKGVTVAMVGMALLIGLSFINPFEPGPWLLGGLIPLFVGLAQIVTALMSGARFGNFGISAPPPGGPQQQQYQQQPPPFTASRDIPPGAYTWRPGNTTELEQPLRPPDKR